MGFFKNGIFGGIRGRVGEVVGSSWKNIEFVRTLPKNRVDAKSEKQVKQRNKLGVTLEFIKTITPFVRVSFQMCTNGRMTPFNAAMSYNMKNAVVEESENMALDFSKVLVSKGPLVAAPNISAERIDNELVVYWDSTLSIDAEGVERPSNSDQAMIVVYNSTKKSSVYDLNAGKRSASSAIIELPSGWERDNIEIFVAFKNAEGNVVSDSVYVPLSFYS